MDKAVRIVPARSPEHLVVVSAMFQAYAESLGIDLSYQDFSTEVNGLPGKYAPPEGEIFLAYGHGEEQPLGCVALRPLGPSIPHPQNVKKADTTRCCEMKRLYVTPAARGTGVGKILSDRIVDEARNRGYDEMRLDTLPSMKRAIEMYYKLGFVEIEAYYHTPIEGTVFLALDLNGKIQ